MVRVGGLSVTRIYHARLVRWDEPGLRFRDSTANDSTLLLYLCPRRGGARGERASGAEFNDNEAPL